VIGIGAGRPEWLPPGCPFARLPMPVLHGRPTLEIWRTDEPVAYACEHGLATARSPSLLFALASDAADDQLQQRTEALYMRLFAAVAGRHLQRLHNYVPAILASQNGEERYRLFNAGRHAAFAGAAWPVQTAPAACGLGAPAGERLLVYGIAADRPGLPIENPAQISAYHYPERYGPKSPIFSRAMLGSGAARDLCFLSGTAAIRGHETLHPGDVEAQLQLAIENIRILLAQAATHGHNAREETLRLRVYLKRPEDLSKVQARMRDLLPEAPSAQDLQAEICRPDLLVEIEGYGLLTGG
jgi:chorismate lyase/3-hydroxybenzoate synthase